MRGRDIKGKEDERRSGGFLVIVWHWRRNVEKENGEKMRGIKLRSIGGSLF